MSGVINGSLSVFMNAMAEFQGDNRKDSKSSARHAWDRAIDATEVAGEQEKIADLKEQAQKNVEEVLEIAGAAVTVVTGGASLAVAAIGAVGGIATCWTGVGAVAGGAAAGAGGIGAALSAAGSAIASSVTSASASAVLGGVADGAMAGLAQAPGAMLSAAGDSLVSSVLTLNPLEAVPNMLSSAVQSGAGSVVNGGLEGGLSKLGGEGAQQGVQQATQQTTKSVAGDQLKQFIKPIEQGKDVLEKVNKRGQEIGEGYNNTQRREIEARKKGVGTTKELAGDLTNDADRRGDRLNADAQQERELIDVQREAARTVTFSA